MVVFFVFFHTAISRGADEGGEPWPEAVYSPALVAAQDGVCSREHAAPRGRVCLPCPAPAWCFA